VGTGLAVIIYILLMRFVYIGDLMPIEPIKKKLYVFIREYSGEKRVSLETLHRWADINHIKRQEMGYALHLLKVNGAAYYSKKYGWMVK
jgi:hypothetical protein